MRFTGMMHSISGLHAQEPSGTVGTTRAPPRGGERIPDGGALAPASETTEDRSSLLPLGGVTTATPLDTTCTADAGRDRADKQKRLPHRPQRFGYTPQASGVAKQRQVPGRARYRLSRFLNITGVRTFRTTVDAP